MKGSPLLRALLALMAIALAGIPLWHLTRPSELHTIGAAPEVAMRAVKLSLTFSIEPVRFAVLHLGRVVWEQDGHGTENASEVKMAFPAEGVDLQFKVVWPPSAPVSALRVWLTDPDGNRHEQTLWGQGEMEEVATFQ